MTILNKFGWFGSEKLASLDGKCQQWSDDHLNMAGKIVVNVGALLSAVAGALGAAYLLSADFRETVNGVAEAIKYNITPGQHEPLVEGIEYFRAHPDLGYKEVIEYMQKHGGVDFWIEHVYGANQYVAEHTADAVRQLGNSPEMNDLVAILRDNQCLSWQEWMSAIKKIPGACDNFAKAAQQVRDGARPLVDYLTCAGESFRSGTCSGIGNTPAEAMQSAVESARFWGYGYLNAMRVQICGP